MSRIDGERRHNKRLEETRQGGRGQASAADLCAPAPAPCDAARFARSAYREMWRKRRAGAEEER